MASNHHNSVMCSSFPNRNRLGTSYGQGFGYKSLYSLGFHRLVAVHKALSARMYNCSPSKVTLFKAIIMLRYLVSEIVSIRRKFSSRMFWLKQLPS